MKWIKCIDQLPLKDGTQYLGFKNGSTFIFYFVMGDWHEAHVYGEIAYEIEFTHWMPLPSPPKDEE